MRIILLIISVVFLFNLTGCVTEMAPSSDYSSSAKQNAKYNTSNIEPASTPTTSVADNSGKTTPVNDYTETNEPRDKNALKW